MFRIKPFQIFSYNGLKNIFYKAWEADTIIKDPIKYLFTEFYTFPTFYYLTI